MIAANLAFAFVVSISAGLLCLATGANVWESLLAYAACGSFALMFSSWAFWGRWQET